MPTFRHLELFAWQQFSRIDVDFHDRLTVLTGANASGKTTVLNLLARHHDWPMTSLATPKRKGKSGPFRFLTRLFKGKANEDDDLIGRLSYSSGEAEFRVPRTDSPTYQVIIQGQQDIPCFFIPSHRPVYRYERLTQIPSAKPGAREAFEKIWNVGKSRYFGSGGQSASFHMKEMLISWSIFGHGNPDMAPDPQLLDRYRGFQDVLRRVLPSTLGFQRLAIRELEVVVECSAHEFLVDAASGGLSALIDLVWQIFMFSTSQDGPYTVLIDEVENHLHPTMQRRVMPDLVEAFPEACFIVSTHAPLVVNSVRDSSVFVLRHADDGLVVSERLDFRNRARSANQVLAEVLGVEFSMPEWAEVELGRIVRRAAAEAASGRFSTLRNELRSVGLEDWMPQALGEIVDEVEP